jgi:hypothetical protein
MRPIAALRSGCGRSWPRACADHGACHSGVAR